VITTMRHAGSGWMLDDSRHPNAGLCGRLILAISPNRWALGGGGRTFSHEKRRYGA